MKNILSILTLAVLTLSINAQNTFLNPSFELWENNVPIDWSTLATPVVGNLSVISKSTDANSGNFSVKIGAKKLIIPISGISTAPGLITNGTLDVMGLALLDLENLDISQLSNLITNGTQLTEKPLKVSGFYKWNPASANDEQFLMATLVISENNGIREVIGLGNYSTALDFKNSAKSSFSAFECNIMYINPNATPTELVFLALTMSLDDAATSFGTLLLDDVLMTTEIGMQPITKEKEAELAIYPNPSTGDFKLNVKSKVELSVYNQLGQIVIPTMNYTPNTKLFINEKGIYYIKIKDSNGTKTKKLIIK